MRVDGADQRIEGVEIVEGQVTELSVEIGSGELAVGVTGGGAAKTFEVTVAAGETAERIGEH